MRISQRYTDWQEIGRGGFGAVYKVYDQALRRFVAIKLLAEKYSQQQELVEIIRQEVIISRDLRHPNICPVHDLYEGSRGIGTVMDFVSGIELRHWMEKHSGRLLETAEQRLVLFIKLTEALAVAHTRIIHRDLKPANVFLVNGDPGQPMIMDFGASIIGQIVADTTNIMGTAKYMSPEQWESPNKVDRRSDLFSLGVLGYELFTDRIPPVSLRNIQKTRVPPKIPLSEIDPPSRFCRALPSSLDRIILHLMAYRQEDRPQSASEVVTVLEKVQSQIKSLLINTSTHLPSNSSPLDMPHSIQLPVGKNAEQDPAWMEKNTVYLPGGLFYLGSKAGFGHANEKPARQVLLSPFRMGIYPVSNREYRRFINSSGYHAALITEGIFAHPDHPVVGISWKDAVAYAEWLGGYLPTEAQWEYAAKGGRMFPSYPWGDDLPTSTRANINRVSEATSPVDSYPTGINPFGLFDLCGNVWEWCRDNWRQEYYQTLGMDEKDPCCLLNSAEKVLRGGSFDSLSSQGRCSFRFHAPHQQKNRSIGFRVVFSAVDVQFNLSEN